MCIGLTEKEVKKVAAHKTTFKIDPHQWNHLK